MPTGRCFCGAIKVKYTREPARTKALCHCSNCRHYTGSTYSHNLVIPSGHFSVIEGVPKEFNVVADSGKSITNCFCGDCGTTLYRYGDSFGGVNGDKVLQAGVLDDVSNLTVNKPLLEMFIQDRVGWVHDLGEEGVDQFVGMPPAPKD